MDGNGECDEDHIDKCSRTSFHALNNTASQLAAHSSTIEAAGLPIAAIFGFMPGLMLGLKRG